MKNVPSYPCVAVLKNGYAVLLVAEHNGRYIGVSTDRDHAFIWDEKGRLLGLPFGVRVRECDIDFDAPATESVQR